MRLLLAALILVPIASAATYQGMAELQPGEAVAAYSRPINATLLAFDGGNIAILRSTNSEPVGLRIVQNGTARLAWVELRDISDESALATLRSDQANLTADVATMASSVAALASKLASIESRIVKAGDQSEASLATAVERADLAAQGTQLGANPTTATMALQLILCAALLVTLIRNRHRTEQTPPPAEDTHRDENARRDADDAYLALHDRNAAPERETLRLRALRAPNGGPAIVREGDIIDVEAVVPR
ncbi:MAG: hypothetical protein AABX89_07430 [Candidatus Thermoplasmatota archaeon]